MNNLTEISITLRKLVYIVILAIISFFFLRILVNYIVDRQKSVITPVPIIPDVRFGKIPQPVFSTIQKSSSGLKFILRNVESRPPETTSAAQVYFMPKRLQSLLSLEKASQFATDLGFTNEPQAVDPSTNLYRHPSDPQKTLILNTVNMNFQLKYDYSQNPGFFENAIIQSKDKVITESVSYIQTLGAFDDTIIKGRVTAEILFYDKTDKKLKPASSISKAQAVRINFFRNDIEGLPVVPPQFNKNYNYVLYSPTSPTGNKILELSYIYWPIDESNYASYPLRNSDSAWQDLIDGYAVVVQYDGDFSQDIVIRKIYLAYYDSEVSQDYLQPVFVFEGENNFAAFLPAITSEWLE
ncbi:hypothetical protein A2Y99_02135 [Candidatus Gottesmanbacteria bacterium RBG_13_37_7]|uniref:Uncharacterized protein n=1 Tax=Candidatus Gottesmanbacteria bacterium RBG_13_37_7 TaxID=1798369 RepID=A0A1F5YIL9_9BACT|nr:MAG: hypothetical protein A2Y99_02135 [Candidatus Gottesmanbacteria bacterium RBG_13_37_7]